MGGVASEACIQSSSRGHVLGYMTWTSQEHVRDVTRWRMYKAGKLVCCRGGRRWGSGCTRHITLYSLPRQAHMSPAPPRTSVIDACTTTRRSAGPWHATCVWRRISHHPNLLRALTVPHHINLTCHVPYCPRNFDVAHYNKTANELHRLRAGRGHSTQLPAMVP